MTGHTTRLNLYLPGGGSGNLYGAAESVDIDKINSNFSILDAALGSPSVADSNLPSKPYLWQVVRATTTDNLLTWNGSKWENYLPARLTASALDSRYLTQAQGTGGTLDSRYFTETELLTGGVLDSRYALKATQNQLNEYVDYSDKVSVTGSGWSANRVILKRRAGFLMQIDVSVTRTGAALSGNLTNARILSTLGGYGSSTYQALSSGPGGWPNAMYVMGTGIYLASIAPTTTINTGDEMTIGGLWIQS